MLSIIGLLALLTYPFSVLRNSNHDVLNYLLDNTKITELEQPIPSVPEPLFLVVVLLIKFVGTVLSVGLVDVPCGIYTPIFVIGAVLGRFYGELVTAIGIQATPGDLFFFFHFVFHLMIFL